MSVPFHKQLDPAKQAGQHVYGFDREPYLKHSNVAPDVTLSDYIARKQETPPRITVDEGLAEVYVKHWGWEAPFDVKDADDYDMHKLIWETALTRGKVS